MPAHAERLAALGVQRRMRADSILIEQGDIDDCVYVVLSGRLRAYLSDARGREITLAYHGPGDYVGEMSLDGGPRSASVQAVEASVCAVVTRTTMIEHLSADPEFARELIMRLIGRARLATESARSMALLDVYGRLRQLLDSRANELAEGSSGVRVIAEKLTHQAIANEIGCSREMVSRLLKDLETGGYLSQKERRIQLLRPLPARW